MNMNTNGNVYTVIYTTCIVVVVAAVLAFAAMSLKPRQDANIQAETISQMLAAAQIDTKANLDALGNEKVLAMYTEKVSRAFVVDAEGREIRTLGTESGHIELADKLKAVNDRIRHGKTDAVELPVYVFDNGGKTVTVIPCYGAGLWGPVWGYLAFEEDLRTLAGAYFDHESETPGLGAKIKDDPDFRARFIGKEADFSAESPLAIVKGGAGENIHAVDAITGATMTSKGLDGAINTWLAAYKPYFEKNQPVSEPEAAPAVEPEAAAE